MILILNILCININESNIINEMILLIILILLLLL